MIDETMLEQRLTALEQAVARLQQRFAGVEVSSNWLERITGSISDEAAFQGALEYGRALRQADRPATDNGGQS